MKTFLLSLSASLVSVLAIAQSLDVLDFDGHIVSGSTIEVWADTGSTMQAQFNVKNKSSKAVDVILKRIEKNVVKGSHNYYCWDVCTDPSPDVSNSIEIAAGDTTEGLHLIADYNPKGKVGVSTIMYVFCVQKSPTDTAYIIVNYGASPNGIVDKSLIGENSISNVYPNPSNASAQLSYSLRSDALKGKILVYNMLGTVVKEIELEDKKAILTIPTSQLNSGLYFYSFMVDEKIISTKRLTVSHQ